MSYGLNTKTLERLCNQLPTLTLEEAGTALADLANEPVFLGTQILPLLSQVPASKEPYIAQTYGGQEDSACLQIFVWPAGAATPIHDHTSWGAYHCLMGSLLEERYERLDNGGRPNTAHLRKLWRRTWSRQDGASTLQPYEGGIHRVANLSSRPAISMHLYGPRLGLLDGRDYDPSRDFVCDRLEREKLAGRSSKFIIPSQVARQALHSSFSTRTIV
jgi:predicted metal-dependent enzyme (double-stranded beta helix superfamily)